MSALPTSNAAKRLAHKREVNLQTRNSVEVPIESNSAPELESWPEAAGKLYPSKQSTLPSEQGPLIYVFRQYLNLIGRMTQYGRIFLCNILLITDNRLTFSDLHTKVFSFSRNLIGSPALPGCFTMSAD